MCMGTGMVGVLMPSAGHALPCTAAPQRMPLRTREANGAATAADKRLLERDTHGDWPLPSCRPLSIRLQPEPSRPTSLGACVYGL